MKHNSNSKDVGALPFEAGQVRDRRPTAIADSKRQLGGAMKCIKRIAVMVIGGTVLIIGMLLIVLPGPAFIVIPLGLTILAVECAWARRLLRSARAVLPLDSKNPARKRISVESVRRSIAFLLRRVRREVLSKRKLT
jgi:uncharacterized protein (TIGR02611 family)